MKAEDVMIALGHSLFIDKLDEARERARESPAELLAEIASFVGCVMAEIPEGRLASCLHSIETHTPEGNPLLKQSMLTIAPWVRAEVACAKAIEAEEIEL